MYVSAIMMMCVMYVPADDDGDDDVCFWDDHDDVL